MPATSQDMLLPVERTPVASNIGLGFLLQFGCSVVLLLALVGVVPDMLLDNWRNAVMALTRTVGAMTGVAVSNQGDIMTVNGFRMRVVPDCTAIHYLVIIICAIGFSAWHTRRYRAAGLAVAIPLLTLFNSIRLLMTGLAGSVSPVAFSLVHEYLWVTVFVVLTMGLWIVWDRWPDKRTVQVDGRHAITVALICTASQAVFVWCEGYVGTALVATADMIARTIVGTPLHSITWSEGRIAFMNGGDSYSGSFRSELYTMAAFAGIGLSEVLRRGMKAWRYGAGVGGCWVFCSSLIALNSTVMSIWGVQGAALYLWVGQGMMFTVLLLVCWWSVKTRV